MIFLIIVLVILGLIGLIQLTRVFELTGKLKGDNQDTVDFKSNKMRAKSWLVFGAAYFAFFIWLIVEYGDKMLPEPASAHGVIVDNLLNFNWVILFIAFFATHIVLFYFASKFYWRPNKKASFITHNNMLELVWTTVPAIVLAVIIIYGLTSWNEITGEAPEEAQQVEIYSKQFSWTARFAGSDRELGEANYNFITGSNPLGVVTPETIDSRAADIEKEIDKAEKALEKAPEGGLSEKELKTKIDEKTRQLKRILTYQRKNEVDPFTSGYDDKVVNGEIHLPVDEPVEFVFRSQDVIHSAYIPHFRVQMNCVPGTPTRFHFTPTITTEEMREKTGDENFDYILLCNKICGAAHYNMQMTIVIESREDYEEWLSEQNAFASVEDGNVLQYAEEPTK